MIDHHRRPRPRLHPVSVRIIRGVIFFAVFCAGYAFGLSERVDRTEFARVEQRQDEIVIKCLTLLTSCVDDQRGQIIQEHAFGGVL